MGEFSSGGGDVDEEEGRSWLLLGTEMRKTMRNGKMKREIGGFVVPY